MRFQFTQKCQQYICFWVSRKLKSFPNETISMTFVTSTVFWLLDNQNVPSLITVKLWLTRKQLLLFIDDSKWQRLSYVYIYPLKTDRRKSHYATRTCLFVPCILQNNEGQPCEACFKLSVVELCLGHAWPGECVLENTKQPRHLIKLNQGELIILFTWVQLLTSVWTEVSWSDIRLHFYDIYADICLQKLFTCMFYSNDS